MARVGSLYDYPFMQIVEDVMREMCEASTESHVEAKYKRVVNNVYKYDVPAEREWDWLKKAGSIALTARYNTGTVSATEASADITGSGTTWVDATHTGQKIKFSGDDQIYTFTYVSATTATISPTYYGDTETGMSYEIFQDTYSLPADFLKWPLDEAVMYYYVGGNRQICKEFPDWQFRKKYTFQPSVHPRGWRMHSNRAAVAGARQIELASPARDAMQLQCDYIKALPEMYEDTATTHATTACTTTTVYTTADIVANIAAGQFLSIDPTTVGGFREWVKISAVGASTITNGITVDTMRDASAISKAITICDAPDMIPTIQKAIFNGACAVIAAEKNDPALKAYLMAYEKILGLDKSRLSKRLYGRSSMRQN